MPTIHTPERSHSSGRGRSSTAHGRAKPMPAFAFGSSTPRDLSHQISAVGRKGLKAKLEEGNGERRDILYYMHKAKSIEGRGGAKGSGYAFGSSTPRSLSHLSKIPREQRVYDAKPARERTTEGGGGVRMSATNPQLANYQQRKGGHESMSTESRNGADEASSEPDIVQDRQTDYGRTTVGGGPKKDKDIALEERGRGKAKLSGAGQSSRKNTKQEKEGEREHEERKESNKMMREEEEEGGRKEGTREDRKEGGGMEEMESKPEEEEEARTGQEEEEPGTGKEEEEE